MTTQELTLNIRNVDNNTAVLEISGDVTAAAENALSEAYNGLTSVKAIILDFKNLEYMNSSGIGLIVTLLIRAKRQSQRLMAVGLSDHYQQIFQLTRLDEAIAIHQSEEEAVAAAV